MKNTGIYLEHANISVKDLDKSIEFFTTVFPHFKVRGSGISNDRKWIHLGDNITYLALNQATIKSEVSPVNYYKVGINHLGFVVEDAAAIAKNLLKAGYKRSYPTQKHEFRIREYFFDAEGNDYEFIQYLSEKDEERNSYKD